MIQSAYGVVLAAFDDTKGPFSLMHEGNLDDKTATKVAMKSLIGTMSFGDNNDDWQNDSLIPITDEKIIAFSSIFFLKDSTSKDGRRAIGIIFTVPIDQQSTIYQVAPIISEKNKLISAYMRQTFEYYKGVSKELQAMITGLLDLESLKIQVEETIQTRKLTIVKSTISPSYNTFFQLSDKNGEQIIGAIIAGEKLAIIGDKGQIELLFTTLERFATHRMPKKLLWTNVPVYDADLVGIPPELGSLYLEQGFCVWNAMNNNCKGGKKSLFCRKLLEDLKQMPSEDRLESLLKTKLSWLVSRTTAILELAQSNTIDDRVYASIKKDIDKDTFDMISRFIKGMNPKFVFPEDRNVWRNLDGF